MSAANENSTTPGLRILGDCPVTLWALPSAERLRRQVRSAVAASGSRPGSVLLVRSDYVYDQRIVAKLVTAENTLLTATEAGVATPVAANVDEGYAPAVERLLLGETAAADSLPLQKATPETLVGAYIEQLLKVEAPLLLPLRPERQREIERRLFDGSYKGVTDVVTKYLWPLPARWAVRFCSNVGIRPNQVTLLGLTCVLLTTALFAFGWFGLGLVLAWFMTFLDTVDGKLARVTIDSSRLGHFLDKIVDIVHPPFWYVAWAIGLSTSAVPLSAEHIQHLMTAMLAGYILGRLSEAAFSNLVGGFSIFSWRPFDSYFRLILARRNPCLIALTLSLLVGRPDLGVILVVVWTVLSAAILLARVFQALYERLTIGPLHPWLNTQRRSETAGGLPGVRTDTHRQTIA